MIELRTSMSPKPEHTATKHEPDDAIDAYIKSEIEAQRAMLAAEVAVEIEARLRGEFESRIAEQVRAILRSTATRTSDVPGREATVQAPRSTGWEKPPKYNGVKIGESGAAWVRAMEEHLRILRECDPLLSESMIISIVISFTEDIARDFAVGLRDELGEKATWATLKSEFLDRFGVTKSAVQLLRDLRAIKQGQSSVASYTNAFESALARLMMTGSSDSLSAMSYYVEGLSPDLNAILSRSFLTMSEDPMEAGAKLQSREAIRMISKLARRCEEIEASLASKAPASAARAAIASQEEVEPRVAVASAGANGARFGRPMHPARRGPFFTREDLLNHLTSKHGVPRAIVEQRLDNHLCARCAGNDHTARICTRPAVKTAAEASSSASQPTNQKAR